MIPGLITVTLAERERLDILMAIEDHRETLMAIARSAERRGRPMPVTIDAIRRLTEIERRIKGENASA